MQVTLSINQRCVVHINPVDLQNNTVPVTNVIFSAADPTIVGLPLGSDAGGYFTDLQPLKAGSTTVTISGDGTQGTKLTTFDVTVTPGPLDHFNPIADAPRTV